MQVRAAAPGDVPQLLALVRRYWEFEGIANFEAARVEAVLRQLLARDAPGCVWVAEQNETLCAYLIVVLVLSVEHAGLMGEIDEFFVLPEARARGVGGRLLGAAEQALVQRGAVRLQLQLGTCNEPARAFYQRRGYQARAGYQLLDKALP
jgi:GNAT superfamily N-acetyltransferase